MKTRGLRFWLLKWQLLTHRVISDPEFVRIMQYIRDNPASDFYKSNISVSSAHTSDLSDWNDDGDGLLRQCLPAIRGRSSRVGDIAEM